MTSVTAEFLVTGFLYAVCFPFIQVFWGGGGAVMDF